MREALRENNQKEIEEVLANPALDSKDEKQKAEAEKEKREVADKARHLDAIDQHTMATFTGKDAAHIVGRDVEQQMADHYKYVAEHDPEFKDPFKAAEYFSDRDEGQKKVAETAHDDSIASSELWGAGKLSTATEVYRAKQAGDSKQQAALLDGVSSNAELKKDEDEFKDKYAKSGDMVQAPSLGRFEFNARLAQSRGDERPIQDIEKDVARADMDASELKIENIREFGARPERRPELEVALQRELLEKQHSDALASSEQMRAAKGGNIGTEDLAHEQLAAAENMLEPPKDVFGIAPRELKPGIDKEQFEQIDQSVTTTLDAQREQKIELSESFARAFTTIAKIGALLTAQPELFALIDVASGLTTMAAKKAIAGEAYDPADDAKMLAINATVDLAFVGALRLGSTGVAAVSVGSDAARVGEQTATTVVERGASDAAKVETVSEGVARTAGGKGAEQIAQAGRKGVEDSAVGANEVTEQTDAIAKASEEADAATSELSPELGNDVDVSLKANAEESLNPISKADATELVLEEIGRAAGGLRRPALELIEPGEIARLQEEFAELGGDPEMLRFNQGQQTAFVDADDSIRVRGDVNPVEGSLHPRSAMSSKAALGHELGHAANRGTKLAIGAWNDEFRASYWAAKNLAALSDQERIHLVLDAMERAKEAGVSIRPNAFMKKVLYGY